MKSYKAKIMKNNRHCKCKRRCYYLHRAEKEILRWKRSIDYQAFKSTYTYLRINEEFHWQTDWKHIWISNRDKWGVESKSLYNNKRNSTLKPHLF